MSIAKFCANSKELKNNEDEIILSHVNFVQGTPQFFFQ